MQSFAFVFTHYSTLQLQIIFYVAVTASCYGKNKLDVDDNFPGELSVAYFPNVNAVDGLTLFYFLN